MAQFSRPRVTAWRAAAATALLAVAACTQAPPPAETFDERAGADARRIEADVRFLADDLLESLLPVLDEIHLAEQHGDLPEGSPFRAIADKLEQVLTKQGLERVGVKGEAFDPNVHEALMHGHSPDVTTTTVDVVAHAGYRIGDRVVRAAKVTVLDPES